MLPITDSINRELVRTARFLVQCGLYRAAADALEAADPFMLGFEDQRELYALGERIVVECRRLAEKTAAPARSTGCEGSGDLPVF